MSDHDMNGSSRTPVTGAQSVGRSLAVLKLLGQSHEDGLKLSDVVELSGLDRATAYRLLSALVAAGFAERGKECKRYRLGMSALELGLAAIQRVPHVDICRLTITALARRTGESVYLNIRTAEYSYCVHVAPGVWTLPALRLRPGDVRVLGVGAAGQALLAALEPPHGERLMQRCAKNLEESGVSLTRLRRAVSWAREHGYAVSKNLSVKGVAAVGLPFRSAEGSIAAITVVGLSERMPASRQGEIARLVQSEICNLGYALAIPRA